MKRVLPTQLATIPLRGTWYRAIHVRYLATAMQVSHTRTIPGRFNPGTPSKPSFPALYLCEDAQVAQFEAGFLLGSAYPSGTFLSNPWASWAILNVKVRLSRVVDLTKGRNVAAIGATIQELTGDWQGYQVRAALGGRAARTAPTQRLGEHLRNLGIEGAVVYSARQAARKNLVVFVDQLQPGSSISWINPATGVLEKPDI